MIFKKKALMYFIFIYSYTIPNTYIHLKYLTYTTTLNYYTMELYYSY